MKVIAESAFNHNGDLQYLKDLALASQRAGADYFTCQVMHAESFCVKDYEKYDIYVNNSFSREQWYEVFDYCQEIEIAVIPCILDEISWQWVRDYGYKLVKIHATDIANVPMLEKIAGEPEVQVLLETQCATHQDIEVALSVIGSQVICLMHGFSNYPTELEDINLKSIDYLADYFGYPTGLADHTTDTDCMPLMALAKGVDFLEKHITLSRNHRHFDWQVSLNPEAFGAMVLCLHNYQKALGHYAKHPVPHERDFRTVMYKKVVAEGQPLQRADEGMDGLAHTFLGFDRSRVGVALIARLKSQRLPRKVMKPLLDADMISVLYNSLHKSKWLTNTFLATSTLEEDAELTQRFGNTFTGHPVSVIDRMLSLARREKWGGIFRVTGDNPLTSHELIDQMIDMFRENELDYVRANNFPFGISAELFSTAYLYRTYMEMENPMHSEYLSWFVLNDPNARKGCVRFEGDERMRRVNLSVDYQADYDRVKGVLERAGITAVPDIRLDQVLKNVDLQDVEPADKIIKLPEQTSISFDEYLQLIDGVKYEKVITYKL